MNQRQISEQQADVGRFGFWLYLLSDLMIFGALFATFMVLRGGTADGPNVNEIVDPGYVLLQTMALLTSSFSAALLLGAARKNDTKSTIQLLWVTFGFGALFLAMELIEFTKLIGEGYSWQTSAFLSSFFALVGTHGLHIFVGLLWLATLLTVIIRRGLNSHRLRKLGLFVLFWHFLDLVWIWIFTIVYMFGAANL